MSWKIVEKHVIAKDPVRGPEDLVYASQHTVAVLDAHSNESEPIGDLTPGQFAAYAGLAGLQAFDGNDPIELVRLLSKYVADEQSRVRRDGPARSGFVFVAFLPQVGKIVRVGDCQHLIDGIGDNPDMAVDRYKAKVRQDMIDQLLQEHPLEELVKDDPTQEQMKELLHWQHSFRNAPGDSEAEQEFGYGVIDGTHVPERYIEVISVPDEAASIVLASDGYPEETLQMTFAATERKVSEVLQEDPLCYWRWQAVRGIRPGLAHPDDRSYVRLERV